MDKSRIDMTGYKKDFEEFLLSTDSFEDVVRILRKNKVSLRAYLNKYKGDPDKVIYHMPFSWTDSGDPEYWKILDYKWWTYCRQNGLE